ncbi:MAG: hypothetical protein SGILL_008272, partial [Bacillariaceae sp.]
MEREMFDIDECSVVVDNARIPLEVKSRKDQDFDALFYERMTRSLSDIPRVSFPPAFLQDQKHASASCRWDSFNSSSSSSDFSLSVPRRSVDDDDVLEGRMPSLMSSSQRVAQVQPTPPTPPL